LYPLSKSYVAAVPRHAGEKDQDATRSVTVMTEDPVVDSCNYAKENMKGAYAFLDRFEEVVVLAEMQVG